jgi:hypothetical protein
MADQPDNRREAPAAHRGEAAWKAAKADIEARNDQARKAGRQQRAAAEERRLGEQRIAELRESRDLDAGVRRRRGGSEQH